MPNYKEMYLTLFRETTKAIHMLQAAQQRAEELYICDDGENKVILLPVEKDKESGKHKVKKTL